MLPETVDLQYLELTRAKAESAVDGRRACTQGLLRAGEGALRVAGAAPARHILITAGDGVDDAAAQKKADELTAQAKGGADFAAARARRTRRTQARRSRAAISAGRSAACSSARSRTRLFAMSPGEIRGPVKTQFGYHILKLDEVEAGHVRDFDEARAELEAEYRKERAQNIFYDESQKLADPAFSSLTELDSVRRR